MTNQELQKLLDYLKYIPVEERDETTNIILKAAADSLTLDKLQALTDGKVTEKTITDGGSFTLRLTEKSSEQTAALLILENAKAANPAGTMKSATAGTVITLLFLQTNLNKLKRNLSIGFTN